jgi:hypothetical protein
MHDDHDIAQAAVAWRGGRHGRHGPLGRQDCSTALQSLEISMGLANKYLVE